MVDAEPRRLVTPTVCVTGRRPKVRCSESLSGTSTQFAASWPCSPGWSGTPATVLGALGAQTPGFSVLAQALPPTAAPDPTLTTTPARVRSRPCQPPVTHDGLRETRNTAAVSSTLSPPKNRSSITLARRGWIRARISSASSSAQNEDEATSGSLLEIWSRSTVGQVLDLGAPPPLLSAARARAAVDEDTPHDPGGQREEVRAIVPVDVLHVHQPQIRCYWRSNTTLYFSVGALVGVPSMVRVLPSADTE